MDRIRIDADKLICYGLIVLVGMLLYMRDAMGIGIGKMIFVAMLIPALLFLEKKMAIVLWVFLMPLYVGLPGNFLTVAFFARLFGGVLMQCLEEKGVVRYAPALLLSAALGCQIFIQNMMHHHTTIYHMICIVELLLIYCIFCEHLRDCLPQLCTAYSAGIAIVGAVMLTSTLRHRAFSELLSAASRLGDVNVTSMSVQIDPNYYGLFAVIALSMNWLMLSRRQYGFLQKVIVFGATGVALCVALIGLSRAFVLCAAIWLLLTALLEDGLGVRVKILFLAAVAVMLVIAAFPDVLSALGDRFSGSDMATGNGRTDKLVYFYKEWTRTLPGFVFGMGLFDCTAHCMQAQYLYGLGLFGGGAMLLLGIYYYKMGGHRLNRENIASVVPILVTQVAASTVPIAQSLTFMLPCVMAVLVFREINAIEADGDSEEEETRCIGGYGGKA